MGIIFFMRLYLFIFLIFPCFLFSQKGKIKLSDNYIVHKISKNDTYHNLKLKYGLSKRKIIKYNPELKKCKFLSDCPEITEIKILITEKNLFVKDLFKDSLLIDISLEKTKNVIDNLNDLDSLVKSNIDTLGIDTLGIDTLGIDTLGIDTLGIDTLGIDTLGIDTLTFKRSDSIVNIAVFLPFLSNTIDSVVSNTSSKKLNHHSFLNESRIAMDFYSGLVFSFHQFSKDSNLVLKVNVFDTCNNIDSIKKILSNNNLDSVDLIFGPLYQKNFNFLVSKINNPNTIIVSPLQSNTVSKNYNRDNVYFFQSESRKKISVTAKYIFDNFVMDRSSSHTVSVFLKEEEEEKKIVSDYLKDWKDNINYYEIEKATISEELSEKEINSISDIVFVPSSNRVFVTDLISRLHALKDTTIILFCNESIVNFDLIPHVELYDLNVHFFSEKTPFFEDSEFIKSFFQHFSIKPQNKYVYNGYRCGKYFVNLFLDNYITHDYEYILGSYYKFIFQKNNILRNEAFKLWEYEKYDVKEVLDFNENQ